MKKRHISHFNVPGQVRFVERNERGKDTELVEFFCTQAETDDIMAALRFGIKLFPQKRVPGGMILARICREWMEDK